MSQPEIMVNGKNIEHLNRCLKEAFPRTFAQVPEFERVRDAYTTARLPCCCEVIHNKKRGKEVAYIAELLAYIDGIEIDGPLIDGITDMLKGKTILSLGDDTGSLTEVLSHFGAVTTGIEISHHDVAAARTGRLSEDRTARTDVIEGDVWHLLFSESGLHKEVIRRGPFDVIFSTWLFNVKPGAGFSCVTPATRRAGEIERRYREKCESRYGRKIARSLTCFFPEKDWFRLFITGIEDSELLSAKGAQLHMHAYSEINETRIATEGETHWYENYFI